MPDPNEVQTDPNPAPPGLPDPNAPAVDFDKIRGFLNLPLTAPMEDVAVGLIEVITAQQQQIDQLTSDATTLASKLSNRDLADFADIIPEEAKTFWAEQLLANREVALETLEGMRALKPAAPAAPPPAAPQPPRVPLANRLTAAPKPLVDMAGGANTTGSNRAVAIRNRAHELTKSARIPWGEAFARAEKEIT